MNLNSIEKRKAHLVGYLSIAALFIIAFFYFYFFENYLFFFQENQSLFVFSTDYFHQFVSKPGGLLVYAGNFLTQGYFNDVYGAVIVSALLSLFGLLFLKINRRLSPGGTFSALFIVIPPCLLFLAQTNFNWFIYNNLGILLGTLFFLFSNASDKKRNRIVALALFPLFYYLVGAFAWIYLGMQIVYSLLYDKGRYRFSYSVLLLVIAVSSLVLFKEVLFFQAGSELLRYPLPFDVNFKHPMFFYILTGFMILLPLFAKGTMLFYRAERRFKTASLTSVAAVFIITILSLFKLNDPKVAELFEIEQLVYNQDWDAAIEHQEKHQSTNMIAQYYYNLALSEQGQLCDRMFNGPQDYGPNSLMITWDAQSGIRRIFRGAFFFYSVGLINEAHRWAYESMVSQGFFPENIKLLIKTELINGHLRTAKKYNDVLKKTLHYRDLASKYEAMIKNPALILSDPELGEKRKVLPKEDFSIRVSSPHSNIPLLLYKNPTNKRAFEYITAWYLLQKNVDAVVNEARRMSEMNYIKIPGHIEEALLVSTFNGGPLPELGELQISEETQSRFLNYSMFANPFSGEPSANRKAFYDAFKNTYWFYLSAPN